MKESGVDETRRRQASGKVSIQPRSIDATPQVCRAASCTQSPGATPHCKVSEELQEDAQEEGDAGFKSNDLHSLRRDFTAARRPGGGILGAASRQSNELPPSLQEQHITARSNTTLQGAKPRCKDPEELQEDAQREVDTEPKSSGLHSLLRRALRAAGRPGGDLHGALNCFPASPCQGRPPKRAAVVIYKSFHQGFCTFPPSLTSLSINIIFINIIFTNRPFSAETRRLLGKSSLSSPPGA